MAGRGVAPGMGGGRPGALAAALAAVWVIWGSTFLAIRWALESIPPFLMAGGRQVAAGAILYALARRAGAPLPSARQVRAGLVTGALLFLGAHGGVSWAEQHVPSGIACLLMASESLWTVLLDWAFGRGKRPGGLVAVALAAGMGGLVLLVGLGGPRSAPLLPAVVLGVAGLSWSAGSVVSRRMSLPASLGLSAGLQMVLGGGLLLALGVAAGEPARLGAVSTRSALAFGYLVVFGSLVGFSAYAWLLRASTAARAATHAYVNPVVALLLGAVLAGEPLTAGTVAAAALVIGSVLVVVGAERPARSGTARSGYGPSRLAAGGALD